MPLSSVVVGFFDDGESRFVARLGECSGGEEGDLGAYEQCASDRHQCDAGPEAATPHSALSSDKKATHDRQKQRRNDNRQHQQRRCSHASQSRRGQTFARRPDRHRIGTETEGPDLHHRASPVLFRAHGMAEGVGFEPTVALATAVFKTAAIVRSATPPWRGDDTRVSRAGTRRGYVTLRR